MPHTTIRLALALLLTLAGCSASPAGGPDAGEAATDADADAGLSCAFVAGGDEPIHVAGDLGSLGGTLSLPDRCGPVPVVLIASGDGTTDRNGNVPGDPARPDEYHLLAQALVTDSHVAVARFDDEGLGSSAAAAPANVADFTMTIEVDDIAREVRALRSDARFDAVMIAGHSGGSLRGMLAAQQTPIDGLLSLEGAGRPVGRVLHDQAALHLTPSQLAQLDAASAQLEHGMLPGPLPSPLDQILPVELQPYFATYFPVDPAARIATLAAPVLITHGSTDTQIFDADVSALRAARPDAAYVPVADMAHSLKQATDDPSDQRAADSDPSVPLAMGLSDALRTFLVAHGAPAQPAVVPDGM